MIRGKTGPVDVAATCQSPSEMKGKSFPELNDNDFHCSKLRYLIYLFYLKEFFYLYFILHSTILADRLVQCFSNRHPYSFQSFQF